VKRLVAIGDLFGMKFATSHPIAVNRATIARAGKHRRRSSMKRKING
jgi:hypothetical protein